MSPPDLSVIAVHQADDGTRYLALAAADARAVRRDRAMLDAVPTLACLDVDSRGGRTWEKPARCADSAIGREAIRAHLSNSQEF